MRISFNRKASSAFKKLGAVALMVATTLALAGLSTSCKQTPTPTPKHEVAFGVEGGQSQVGQSGKPQGTAGGTLKAKAEGIPETEASPITIEQGKVITFKAEAKAGYRVKGWTLDGSPVAKAGTNTEYKLKVTHPATVKVSFESNSTPPAPQTKYTVTLTQTGGGKVTASPAIPADEQVAKDTEITFTATANAGYRVGTWSVTPSEAIQSGGGEGETTATVKITADTTVSVNFEAIPEVAILTLSEKKLTIKVKAKTSDGKPIEVEGCNETTLASDVETTLNAKGRKVILKGKITELDCSFNKLSALDLQGLTALQKLKCSVNKLDKLNVQGLTSLQRLECGYNDITALDLQGLTSLEYLDCSPNQLRTLNASGLTALQQLWCSNNKLTTLDVQGCTALEKLSCWNNNLNALNVQGCTTLKSLICWCNKLNAQAMTKLLKALPAREASDDAEAQLYTEQETSEGNWKDYTKPEDLKKAFEGAKGRNWKLKVQRKLGGWGDI